MLSEKRLLGSAVRPRKLSSILISLAGLAVFLTITSWVIVSYPTLLNPDPFGLDQNGTSSTVLVVDGSSRSYSEDLDARGADNTSSVISPPSASNEDQIDDEIPISEKHNEERDISTPAVSSPASESEDVSFVNSTSGTTHPLISLPATPNDSEKENSNSGSCDLYHGKWVHDPDGPLYTNNTCPIITRMQNCQGNGRPDKDYENWRWKPDQCDLPRMDPRKFLELMRGKTLAFIGDSVARNQMESMLCILWQVEVPKNRGNRRMHRYYFRSTSTMIVRVWSSWLVQPTNEAVDSAPKGVVKLHLDKPDENFMELLPKFDVVVLSSGHWFAKQSVYLLNNKVVGGQLWWPDKNKKMQTNNIDAFGVSVETIISAIANHPNYTGLTIIRSYSPDHYEGGAWNTGGSCTGKTKPATEFARSGFTDTMHEQQVKGFEQATKKAKKYGSKLRFMDITEVFSYRHDGHPGPYRSPDPNKLTKRGPDGKPPPQDCLHWCMPGPVDTWNELVMEIIRKELQS